MRKNAMVLNKMRLHPQTAHIPVIIASTTTQLRRDNEKHLRSKEGYSIDQCEDSTKKKP
jgi:hypothetical protein